MGQASLFTVPVVVVCSVAHPLILWGRRRVVEYLLDFPETLYCTFN